MSEADKAAWKVEEAAQQIMKFFRGQPLENEQSKPQDKGEVSEQLIFANSPLPVLLTPTQFKFLVEGKSTPLCGCKAVKGVPSSGFCVRSISSVNRSTSPAMEANEVVESVAGKIAAFMRS